MKAGPIMNSWNEDDLCAIAESHDLYISPFREDGTTYGTPTLVWPLVVDGEVYVRTASGQQSSWYVAALSQKAGRIRVGGKDARSRLSLGGAAAGKSLSCETLARIDEALGDAVERDGSLVGSMSPEKRPT